VRAIDAVEQDLVYVHDEEHPLPDDWKVTTLEGLIADGGLFCDGDWVESKDQDPNGDVRLIQLADIGVAFYRDRSDRYLTSERASALSCTFLQRGDILVARMPDPLGRACLFPGDKLRAVTVVDVAVIRQNNPEVDSRWLMQRINSMAFRNAVASLQSGSTRLRISRRNLSRIAFPLPPLVQQLAVVDELEKQFSRLDEAVANLQRVKANLKRYKASVLKAAVEGRLVETEATLAHREGRTYETGEQLLQRTIEARSSGVKARRAKAEPAALTSADKKEVPDGWVWTTTGQLCECIVPNRDKPKTFSGDIPWLTLPDFDDSEIAVARSKSGLGFTESEVALYRAKVIPTDSVVMSCVGRFGISAVITRKAVINQQLHAFLPSEGVAPKYLAYVLRTREQEMLEKSTATTIAYLNKENCNSISVPLPPLAEQARIVAEVDRHLSIIREVEAEVDANLQRAQALRQATLAKAFSQ